MPESTIGPDAVITGIYKVATMHEYGVHLHVYDVDRRTLQRLPDAATAARYFETSRSVSRPSCAPGLAGQGAPIFDSEF